ncbi:MAG: TRAP transporter large permease subunit, partial [Deltaproteobacteria bacterium]|nr:TRAP transporter large permease subunit [Deltaproteobacteria bacterium]
MSYEAIALTMFGGMLVMLLTGQRVFAAIGFVSATASLFLYGTGAVEMPFNAAFNLFNWYPMLTLPMFIYMGYILSETGIADDLYGMFHVWFGGLMGGLAIGTIGLMVVISAMNGLSVAGMAIGATIILVPPSVVLVLYGMIARQPVGRLWLAGIIPGFMMAGLFVIYIVIRCMIQPELAPTVSKEDRDMPLKEKLKLLKAGIIPFLIFFFMTGLFIMGITSLVESSAVGASAATIAAIAKRRLTRKVMEETLRQTLGITCMFMWIILAALCFGAVFDGIGAVKAIESLFITKWSLSPWQVLVMMQLSYIVMGMFLD